MLWGKFIFEAPDSTLFLEGLRGFGGVDDLKKAEMDKTLRNGLIMSEMDPLNQKWLDFVILSGLTLHQFQTKLLLRHFKCLIHVIGVKVCIKLHDKGNNFQNLSFIFMAVYTVIQIENYAMEIIEDLR